MNFLKKTINTLKPSVIRFPASLALGIYATVIFSIYVWQNDSSKNDALLYYGTDACLAIIFSVLVQFSAEPLTSKFESKKIIQLVLQIICTAACFFPCRQIFGNYGYYEIQKYGGLLLAFTFLIYYQLRKIHTIERTAPSIIISGMISGTATGSFVAGVSIIILAVIFLLLKNNVTNEYKPFLTTYIFSGCILSVQFFLGYIIKKDFKIPKSFKVIIYYIIFPLYALYLLVLYIYLAQSLVQHFVPHMNWFASIATAVYFSLYFLLKPFKNKVTGFFYKAGHFFLYPIVAIQVINFFIRLNAYGFTEARAASLYYIIFSVLALLVPLYKKRKYMIHTLVLLAGLCVTATCTPLNITDVTLKNQSGKILKIYKSHGLYENGKLITENAKEIFSDDEKNQIKESFDCLYDSSLFETEHYRKNVLIPYLNEIRRIEKDKYFFSISKDGSEYKNKEKIFEALFGFAYRNYTSGKNEEIKKCINFEAEQKNIDISEFNELCLISKMYNEDGKFYIECAFGKIDITEFVESSLIEIYSHAEKIMTPEIKKIRTESGTVFLTSLDVLGINFDTPGENKNGGKWEYYFYSFNGFVAR